MAKPGKVYLVGAGPGDFGLLTLHGSRCLAQADVVLYDYLVNSQILSLARVDAERICLGRHGRDNLLPQHEINEQLVALARQGRVVVRLKGGDPAVFAHLGDEVDALETAGVAYEIVPGITAALAVGSYTGIPLTHGDAASAVALITGQERSEKPAQSLDYAGLARFPGTLVFYMGVTTARQWTAELMAAGKPGDTPAAIVRRCTWSDQQTIRCTLAQVAEEIQSRRLRPPALVIVGPVAALGPQRSWFVDRPLSGRRVLVTRASQQAQRLTVALNELGAEVLAQPAIEIGPPADWSPVDAALARLAEFDWVVFASANGVREFIHRLLTDRSRDLRALATVKLAAVGSGTAEELAGFRLRADLVPTEFRSESLADALRSEAVRGQRFLLVRANRGRELLAAELQAAGGKVEQIAVYSSSDVATADPEVLAALGGGQVDWVTVTSPAIASSLVHLLGDDLRQAKLASISPLTSARLQELGYSVAAEAQPYTIDAMVAAILAAEGK